MKCNFGVKSVILRAYLAAILTLTHSRFSNTHDFFKNRWHQFLLNSYPVLSFLRLIIIRCIFFKLFYCCTYLGKRIEAFSACSLSADSRTRKRSYWLLFDTSSFFAIVDWTFFEMPVFCGLLRRFDPSNLYLLEISLWVPLDRAHGFWPLGSLLVWVFSDADRGVFSTDLRPLWRLLIAPYLVLRRHLNILTLLSN